MNDRIIKETELNIWKLPRSRNEQSTTILQPGKYAYGQWRIRPGKVIHLYHTQPPEEMWLLGIRGRLYGYRTEAEANAFLHGKYSIHNPCVGGLIRYDLQLFCSTPRHPANTPVVQHLNDHFPWCVQYRRSGQYFATFAELQAYIDGRWRVYIGEESLYL